MSTHLAPMCAINFGVYASIFNNFLDKTEIIC